MQLRYAAALVLAVACGRGHGDRAAAPPATPAEAGPVPAQGEAMPAVAAADMAAPVPPPSPLSEADARSLLAGALRDGGLRILHDVRVQGPGYDVTLDGWDPARRIGFEYIAAEEVDTDLDAAERAALAAATDVQVLVLDAADGGAVEPRLREFLAALR